MKQLLSQFSGLLGVSFKRSNHVIFNGFDLALFQEDDEETLEKIPNGTERPLNGIVKYIPGDDPGDYRRCYVEGYTNAWIDAVLIPRLQCLCGDIIPEEYTNWTYSVLMGGNKLQEPHTDDDSGTEHEPDGISFLIAHKDSVPFILYDENSYDEAINSIEYCEVTLKKFDVIVFDSNKCLHGGGITFNERIFLHVRKPGAGKDFNLKYTHALLGKIKNNNKQINRFDVCNEICGN
jgi:hypothetical protein